MNKFVIFILILCVATIRTDDDYTSDDEYGNELSAVTEALNFANHMYSDQKHEELLTEFKVKDKDITMNVGNLLKDDQSTKKSFRRLHAYTDNLIDGTTRLKNNSKLKKTLNIILKDPTKTPETRVGAAKLASRLNDLPVTIQYTQPDTNRSPKNYTTHIIVPRINRIYRPDYYVENYKAGNWQI